MAQKRTRSRTKYERVGFVWVRKDFKPEVFGRLTTIGPEFLLPRPNGSSRNRAYQVCECECGVVKVFYVSDLKISASRSCGCIRAEQLTDRNTIHAEAYTVEYNTWRSMKARCYNPNDKHYHNYGGRGIKVCDRWLEPDGRGYMNFLEDMGRRPSTKHSIDRIDVNGDYCPENCKWATSIEQANNRTNNHILTLRGKTQTLAERERETGIPSSLIRSRIRLGMQGEDVLKAGKHPGGPKTRNKDKDY